LLLVLLAALAGGPGAASCRRGREIDPGAPLAIVGGTGSSLGYFRAPRAIAVEPASGGFYVADRSGRIQRFDREGKALSQWYLPEYAQGQPVGLFVEADGSLLVNDSHYHRLLRYRPDGGEIVARWGTEGTGPGQFTFGRDVVVDAEGFIYAGDYGGLNDRIEKFTRDGAFVLEWGGRGEEPGRFQRPQGMAVERRDGEERILVADCANHRIQRFTRDGKFVDAFGKVGTAAGEMRYPYGVAAGADGMLYVSEWGNNRIQRFHPDGRPAGFWGAAGRAAGELATPWEIAAAPDGRLLVADCGNDRVQIFHWPGEGERLGLAGPRRP
jgi:DNA-binding beta-propeller fold protein YncE